MDIDGVVNSCEACWYLEGLSFMDVRNGAYECFVEDGVDGGYVIRAALRQAGDLGLVR